MTALAEARADGELALRRPSRAWSPAATACRRRSSRRRWSRRSSTSSPRRTPQQPLHRRHRRRRDAHVAPLGSVVPDRGRRTSSASLFYGLGADGTVGANKNSIKIIGEETDRYAQGYFVYDSKKSGAITISHLRFGPRPIRSAYLVDRAELRRLPPVRVRRQDRRARARRAGRGVPAERAGTPPTRSGTTCRARCRSRSSRRRSASSPSTPTTLAKRRRHGRAHQHDHADLLLRDLRRAAARGGDRAHQEGDREDLRQARPGGRAPELRGGGSGARAPARDPGAGGGERHAHAAAAGLRAGARLRAEGHRGDAGRQGRPAAGERLPGRRHLAGRRPRSGRSATSRSRSRSGTPKICIQCNQCALVCPHAAIRAKVYDAERARPARRRRSSRRRTRATSTRASTTRSRSRPRTAPAATCASTSARPRTGPTRSTRRSTCSRRRRCGRPSAPTTTSSSTCPSSIAPTMTRLDHKSSQFLEPLFEYSGACAGCGETPYLKLLTQLFGDRLLIANATGCSSIYGGNLPTTPYTTNRDGRGPAWSNSLFEDNAEFGFGFRLGARRARRRPRAALVAATRAAARRRPGDGAARRRPVERGGHRGAARARRGAARRSSPAIGRAEARRLETLADYLVKKSVWLVGGDGWAYDIGYGGLDHVLASRRNVNVLVLDTEVYSNTGGQQSKATPLGAAAKFAAAGKAGRQEGPGPAGQQVRPRLRRARRLRRQDGADRAGVPRGRGLPRAVAHHRLQPLHRPRLRHGARRGAAEAGGRLRRLAALPLRSAPARQGRAAAAPRLRSAQGARSPTTCATSRASAWSSAPIPRATRRSSRSRRRPRERRYAVYEQLAGITVPGDSRPKDDGTDAAKPARRRSAWISARPTSGCACRTR